MRHNRIILISQVALTSILAYSFATPMFASIAVPNPRASFLRRALVMPNQGLLVAQAGMLGERLREREGVKIKEVEEQLEKNPKLVDDPNYLEQHPRLGRYIKNHPEAKQEIERDPRAFFANMEGQRKNVSVTDTVF